MIRTGFGKFQITSGKMVCSDPCYPLSLKGGAVEVLALNGEWDVEVTMIPDELFGRETYRCEGVIIRHAESHAYPDRLDTFSVGVDSGQFGFFDRDSYPETESARGEYDDLDSFYGKSCALTRESAVWGCLPDRVVTSSGYGDGSYTLTLGYLGDKVVSAMVDFIEDVDDDEERED